MCIITKLDTVISNLKILESKIEKSSNNHADNMDEEFIKVRLNKNLIQKFA